MRQASVVERVLGVARLLEVSLLEGVFVDDQRATRLEAVQLGHQRCRVHRDQHVRLVAGRGDVVVGDVDLEGGHAADRAGRGADLGREVGHRRQVVAEAGAHGGETAAGELHPVSGVAGEADDEVVEDSIVVGFVWPFDRVGHVGSPVVLPAPACTPIGLVARHRCRSVVM